MFAKEGYSLICRHKRPTEVTRHIGRGATSHTSKFGPAGSRGKFARRFLTLTGWPTTFTPNPRSAGTETQRPHRRSAAKKFPITSKGPAAQPGIICYATENRQGVGVL